MTPRASISPIFFILFSLISFIVSANNHAVKKAIEISKPIQTNSPADHSETSNKAATLPDTESKVPHAKVNPPHMEELPHIHKFHKGRIKKIKKYHSKYLLLAQIIIVLCHISILIIAYLHATH